MSKFTKALEKLQNQKEEKRPAAAAPELEEVVRHWESGIPSIHQAKPDHRVVTYHFPHSLISEQYRMLRTNLVTQFQKDNAKVILISSSVHGEGKTVTATNLAISLAELPNVKVALIDADLRRGKIADYLQLGKDLKGLSNLLMEDLTPKQVMVKNSLKNLVIMPRGKAVKNSAELISTQKFRILMAELRPHFDYIIVDAPPIMSVTDANILAKETDGVLLVIQSGRTPKNVIAHSHLLFEQGGIKIMGYVITNVEYQSADSRYYYHYNYSYYGEGDPKERNSIKHRVRRSAKAASQKFQGLEERFNDWWEKAVVNRENKKNEKKKENTPKEAINN